MRGIGRNVRIAELDFVEEFRTTFGVEGWQTNDHFVDKGTQAPPINWLSVALLVQNFWGKVFWSAAH